MKEATKDKRTAVDVVISKFLKDVEEKETMPWQRPYERYNAFNYFTKQAYRGINRLILPFGEYITKNQINAYNEKHGEDFRFQKGIEWYPVVFFTSQEKEITIEEVQKVFEDYTEGEEGYIGSEGIWNYYFHDGKYIKKRNVLRYTDVADRKHFKNSKGEMLPSRIETGEVVLTFEEPKKVIDRYVQESGVKVNTTSDTPCYIPLLDVVELNPYVKDEEAWFSTAFHELAHSTGHKSRLDRKGIHYPKDSGESKKNLYAVEECIAEITACLLCAECGIYTMETSQSKEYENNLAYVKSWKKRVEDWGKEFVYIVSQADSAFNLIVGIEAGKDR